MANAMRILDKIIGFIFLCTVAKTLGSKPSVWQAVRLAAKSLNYIYVMTVGALRPVNLGSSEISNAMSMSGFSITLAWPSTFSFSYESMYKLQREKGDSVKCGSGCSCFTTYRTVAPELPVPLRRITMRLPSSKTMRNPCLVATDLSTGSV